MYNQSMKITGIICEYNPFHNGHIHHIKETKKISNPDILVCVMSGNFVQRGEAAITNKWDRAKIAVEQGCDIVFELPFIYATQSANYFAKGGITCLKLADVNNIVFGSESNNLDILRQLASIDNSQYSDFIKGGLSSSKAYEQIYGTLNPNDILGINYLKEIENSQIIPYTIQRTNHYHEEAFRETYSSATSIRKAIQENKEYDKQTPMHDLSSTFSMEYYFPYIKTLLLTTPPQLLQTFFLMDEGIENNLIKNAKSANTYDKFISLCVSKRYTKSRIQRTLIHLINHTSKECVNTLPPINYLRVLAYNDNGKEYLKLLSKKEDLIVASKFAQIPQPYRDIELKATSVYAYPLQGENQQELIQGELQRPIYVPTKKSSNLK